MSRPNLFRGLRVSSVLLGLAALASSTANAQTLQGEDLRFGSSDAEANDEFSSGIAIDGDRMVIGAGKADVGPGMTSDQGVAYALDFNGTTWVETQIFRASTANIGDQFGSDLDMQGDTLVVGAYLSDITGSGDEGQAFVFRHDGTSWVETQILSAGSPGVGDRFSQTVVLEGEFLFISSQFKDAVGTTLGDEGSVYVFRDVAGSFVPFSELVASDAEEGDLFGSALSVSGNRLVVGSQHESNGIFGEAGAAYVFEFDGDNWDQTAKLIPSIRHADQHFGSGAAVDGNCLVIGAEENDANGGLVIQGGALWVFNYDGTNWVETALLEASDAQDNDNLGWDVDIVDDFIVGSAPGVDDTITDQGAVYVFELVAGTWVEAAKLQARSPGDADELGREVRIDGNNVYSSARSFKPGVGDNAGGVFVFDLDLNASAVHSDFTGLSTAGVAPLNVSFTDLSQGSVTSWTWDFGDGGSSTQQNPSHLYTGNGTYDVSLVATGLLGSDLELQAGLVQVGPPTAFFISPTVGILSRPTPFQDLSVGAVNAWNWKFRNGALSTTYADRNPTHTFTKTGIFQITLVASGPGGADTHGATTLVVDVDSNGSSMGTDATNAQAPMAAFQSDVTSGPAPLAVQFSDASIGAVTSWAWTFGDGGTSTLQDPSYTYLANGSYTVSLAVSGSLGSDSVTSVNYITVADAPVAEFSADVLTGMAPLGVNFTDLSTGTVTSWSWNFGDGGSSTAQNPSYTYAAAGTYDVTLTATGPGGPDGETKVGFIVVTPGSPVAEFAGDVLAGSAPLSVNFSDLSTGAVTSWAWDFGDGNTSTTQNPSNAYAAAGT
ncbi:MAG: PKD repeat protein, partial [Planctomycetota bacterium]